MLSDAQLACLLLVSGPLTVAAIFGLADIIERAVGGLATPVELDEALHVIAGHALRIAMLVPALVTGALALVFGGRVRP